MAVLNQERAAEAAVTHRGIVLATVTAALVIVTLDTTILNVAVPTIQRDLHAELSSLQWVLAGYSLTLGSLLIIGGRLGDLFGTRRAFVTGALVFAAGSLLAAMATSVWMLVLGEAVIEGIGASLLMPAALASISMGFRGPDRARAFGVTGGAAGAAAALGPVVGGWLTTDLSWRWGFGINVVVAPFAALVAFAVLPPFVRRQGRPHLDWIGATMVAAGLFLLVFALTEGATYGWLLPLRTFAIGSLSVWPKTMPIAAPAAAAALASAAIVGFVALERRRTGARREPLVELGDFRVRGFRFGLATAAAVVMAQAGVMFVLAVYLQTTHRLSAAATGGWLLPVGAAVLIGAHVGGTIAARLGPATVVRAGLLVELAGVVLAAATVGPDVAFAVLAPALGLFGIGAGLANSQLWNIILSDVPGERAGAASGVVTTNNSVAAALGVAAIGTVLRATESGTAPARWALIAAAVVVAVGTVAATAIPRMAPTQRTSAGRASTPGEPSGPSRTPTPVRLTGRREEATG